MKPISKGEMMRRFDAFEMAYRELNDGWNEYDTSAFGDDYPFECHDGDFGDLMPCVIEWCATSVRSLKAKTINDMKLSRRLVRRDTFESDHDIETDLSDCEYLFVYFDCFYIGVTEETRFRLVIESSDMYTEDLADAERIFWGDFLKDEINAR